MVLWPLLGMDQGDHRTMADAELPLSLLLPHYNLHAIGPHRVHELKM